MVTRDRRLAARRQPDSCEPLSRVRVRAGNELRVINVSSRGALVEGEARLLPGTHLDVHVIARSGRTLVRSRVVRAAVTELRSDRVVYRTALAFERLVDLPAAQLLAQDAPSDCVEARPSDGCGGGTRFPAPPPPQGNSWELATRPAVDFSPAGTNHGQL